MEHINTINAILDQAKENKKSVSITMLDLKNAFGSVSHSYILDMLQHASIPREAIQYIRNCYNKLSVYIQTKSWQTSQLKVGKGMFQGDTLSPTIFLLAFAPITRLMEQWHYSGFSLQIPVPNSKDLPSPDSTIYVLWDEQDSDEPSGWYRATISHYLPNGNAVLNYSSQVSETLSLIKNQWTYTRKNAKKFIPLDDQPPVLCKPTPKKQL